MLIRGILVSSALFPPSHTSPMRNQAADCSAPAITAAYAAATEARPNDPEALAGLFGCYVREGSYVKQQQVRGRLAARQPSTLCQKPWLAPALAHARSLSHLLRRLQ